jgi:hypothetical protein
MEKHWSGDYYDDRMFVMKIGRGAAGGKPYVVTTHRNVVRLPTVREEEFETLDAAIAYVKRTEPGFARVSLGGNSPTPAPSYEEHLRWLRERGLRSAVDGDRPAPDAA